VKLARLRRPKVTCSPLLVDYRSKTNAAIWDMDHTIGRPYTGGTGQGKEAKNLNVFCAYHIGMNIEILNWPWTPLEED
jgi:hypothetical protein